MPHTFLRTLGTFLLGAFLTVLPAQAQGFTGGLHVGLAATTFTDDSDASFDPRTSLSGGVNLGYDFGNGFSIQPEILYVIKGAYHDDVINNVSVRRKFSLTYLEFPVLAVYQFSVPGRIQPRLFAGPSFAFNTDAVVENRAQVEDPIDLGAVSLQNAADTDYGLVVGAGAVVEMAGQFLSFNLRVLLGRSDISETVEEERPNDMLFTAGEEKRHNLGVLITTGIVF